MLDANRRSLLLLIAIIFTVVYLSVIHLGFLSPVTAFYLLISASPDIPCHSESFTSTFHRCYLLLSRFLVLPSASHSFKPLTHSFQLLVAKVDFSWSQDVLQESHKSGFVQRVELIKFLLHCAGIAVRPLENFRLRKLR